MLTMRRECSKLCNKTVTGRFDLSVRTLQLLWSSYDERCDVADLFVSNLKIRTNCYSKYVIKILATTTPDFSLLSSNNVCIFEGQLVMAAILT